MTLHAWLGLVTCVGALGLALLCLARSGQGPLAPPLALLCLVIFGWSFAEWAFAVSGARAWRVLDVTLSPMTLPAALYFVLAFVGARRRLAWFFALVGAASLLLGLVTASGFVSAWGVRFSTSPLRGQVQGALIVPVVAAAIALLVRHERAQSSMQEKIRTRLVLAALALGGTLAAIDAFGVRLPIPSMLATIGLLALATLRFRFFDTEPSRLAVVYTFTVAILGVLGYLGVFRAFATNAAVLTFALVTVTVAFAAAVRQAVAAIGAQRAQGERLAVLGRLSAQMAHDLKNPLTALKGAVQFLQTERAEGRSIDAQGEFLDLLGKEIDRLSAMIDRYRRLGRLEPVTRTTDANEIVRRVASLRRMGLPAGIALDIDLAPGLPTCEVDPDLLVTAIDNLVSNAIEALDDTGRVVLRTRVGDEDAPAVVIAIADDGRGMDVRQQERAFEEFFTTKASGSGLGLSFVKRVAEAHGGRIVLESCEGAGTEVRLILPATGSSGAS